MDKRGAAKLSCDAVNMKFYFYVEFRPFKNLNCHPEKNSQSLSCSLTRLDVLHLPLVKKFSWYRYGRLKKVFRDCWISVHFSKLYILQSSSHTFNSGRRCCYLRRQTYCNCMHCGNKVFLTLQDISQKFKNSQATKHIETCVIPRRTSIMFSDR